MSSTSNHVDPTVFKILLDLHDVLSFPHELSVIFATLDCVGIENEFKAFLRERNEFVQSGKYGEICNKLRSGSPCTQSDSQDFNIGF